MYEVNYIVIILNRQRVQEKLFFLQNLIFNKS